MGAETESLDPSEDSSHSQGNGLARKIEALNNRADQYLTETKTGLQVWLIVTSAAMLPMLYWMYNMSKERDTGEITPGKDWFCCFALLTFETLADIIGVYIGAGSRESHSFSAITVVQTEGSGGYEGIT
ncbi:hypothetical protein V8E52_006776 [Russula decolorans]